MFRLFSAIFLFSRVSTGVERANVLGGFPWFSAKHQGMEDQGTF